MTTADILRNAAARVLLGWTRNTYARDAQGHEVGSGSDAAAQWCAVGAVMCEAGPRASAVLALMGGAGKVIEQNDHVWTSAQEAAAAMLAAADAADRAAPTR